MTLAELQEALSAKKLSSFLESMGISTQDSYNSADREGSGPVAAYAKQGVETRECPV